MISVILRCIAVWATMLLLLAGCAGSQDIKLTGIYSDLDIHAETGDLLGQEVFIVFANDGHYAIVQLSEGEPIAPQICKIRDRGNGEISFDFKNGSGQTVTFSGTVGRTHLAGTLNQEVKIVLPRRRSYWE